MPCPLRSVSFLNVPKRPNRFESSTNYAVPGSTPIWQVAVFVTLYWDEFPKTMTSRQTRHQIPFAKLFGKRNTLAFGASFGVIGVLPKKSRRVVETKTLTPTEVATFRSDGTYSDGRRPDSVHFGTAEQDALRRDFTINGMFYDPAQGCVIDYVGGVDDLRTEASAYDRRCTSAFRRRQTADAKSGSVRDDHRIHVDRRNPKSDCPACRNDFGRQRRTHWCRNAANLNQPKRDRRYQLLARLELARFVFPEWQGADHPCATNLLENLTDRSFSTVLACLLLTMETRSLSPIANRWKLSGEEQREINAALTHHRRIIDATKRPWSQVQPVLIDRDIGIVIEVAEAVAKTSNADLSGIRVAQDALCLGNLTTRSATAFDRQ